MFNLTKYLQEADTIVSKVGDLSIIPMTKTDKSNKANISSKTLDGMIMFSIVSKDDYNYNEFAFRDWNTVSGILSSFRNVESFNIDIETKNEDGLDYPYIIKFNSDLVNINHFVQRYSVIQKSPMIAKQYNDRKLLIKMPTVELLPINEEIYTELSRVAGVINKKYFHIEKIDGDYYYCFGDMGSKSIDYAKLYLGSGIDYNFETGKRFPVNVVLALIKALNFKCKVGMYKGYLFISGETENTTVDISIAGRLTD